MKKIFITIIVLFSFAFNGCDSKDARNYATELVGILKSYKVEINKKIKAEQESYKDLAGTYAYAKQMNGNAQILEAIKADHSGIGYVGAGYVANGNNKGIKILLIYSGKNEPAISPLDATMIAAGKYYFQRPLFQYYKTSAYNKVKPFIDFEKSMEGKKIIQSAGYYPVNK